MDGVTGDGIRTDPLSFKATVKLFQVIGQACVIHGVGGFCFVICDLSEPPPNRSRVIG